MSWGNLAKMTDLPVSTIRDIVNGNTKHPSIDAVASIVTAMGGSLDALSGSASQFQEFEHRAPLVRKAEEAGGGSMNITIETMRSVRIEMLEAQRTAYERQIKQIREDYEKVDKYKTKMIRYLAAALAFLVVFIISVLVIDLLNRDVGWFQTVFGDAKMSGNRLSGIVDIIRSIFGGAA